MAALWRVIVLCVAALLTEVGFIIISEGLGWIAGIATPMPSGNLVTVVYLAPALA